MPQVVLRGGRAGGNFSAQDAKPTVSNTTRQVNADLCASHANEANATGLAQAPDTGQLKVSTTEGIELMFLAAGAFESHLSGMLQARWSSAGLAPVRLQPLASRDENDRPRLVKPHRRTP